MHNKVVGSLEQDVIDPFLQHFDLLKQIETLKGQQETLLPKSSAPSKQTDDQALE